MRRYGSQMGGVGIRGVIVVVSDEACLKRIRKEISRKGAAFDSTKLTLTTLRSQDEKLQFESLLLNGEPAIYHSNPR